MPDPIAVSKEKVERVWRHISRHPRDSIREIAAATQMGHVTVRQALLRLQELGYLEQQRYQSRARRVVVLFGAVSQTRIVKRTPNEP